MNYAFKTFNTFLNQAAINIDPPNAQEFLEL